MKTNNPKQLAQDLVKSIAPQELPLFEDMWADYERYGSIDQADSKDNPQGFGLPGAELNYLTAIIIPLAMAFSTELVKATAQAVFAYIKEKIFKSKAQLLTLNDEQLTQLAEQIAQKMKK